MYILFISIFYLTDSPGCGIIPSEDKSGDPKVPPLKGPPKPPKPAEKYSINGNSLRLFIDMREITHFSGMKSEIQGP